jgi:hypothetical protein
VSAFCARTTDCEKKIDTARTHSAGAVCESLRVFMGAH